MDKYIKYLNISYKIEILLGIIMSYFGAIIGPLAVSSLFPNYALILGMILGFTIIFIPTILIPILAIYELKSFSKNEKLLFNTINIFIVLIIFFPLALFQSYILYKIKKRIILYVPLLAIVIYGSVLMSEIQVHNFKAFHTNCDKPITTPLQYNGIYQSEKKDTAWSYLRFYADGTVISVPSTGNPPELIRWFKKENISNNSFSSGCYEIKGNQVAFSTTGIISEEGATGTVEYRGQIVNNILVLNTHSLINGFQNTERYNFVQLSSLVPKL